MGFLWLTVVGGNCFPHFDLVWVSDSYLDGRSVQKQARIDASVFDS
jgi:hypothetical protein